MNKDYITHGGGVPIITYETNPLDDGTISVKKTTTEYFYVKIPK